MGDNARRAYVLADRYDAGSGVMRSRWNEYWERPSANTKAPTTVTSWTLAIDPNLQRHMPGQIATDLQPAVQPAVEPETDAARSEEHTSELQSLMRISYAGFCLNKKNKSKQHIVN